MATVQMTTKPSDICSCGQVYEGVRYGIRYVSWSGCPQLHGVAVEDNILQLVDDDPTISTRRISATVGISQTSVWRLIRRQQLQPFHLQKVHDCYLRIILDASSSVSG